MYVRERIRMGLNPFQHKNINKNKGFKFLIFNWNKNGTSIDIISLNLKYSTTVKLSIKHPNINIFENEVAR